jgi:hypothetical protein
VLPGVFSDKFFQEDFAADFMRGVSISRDISTPESRNRGFSGSFSPLAPLPFWY